jgi:hypothetical protein
MAVRTKKKAKRAKRTIRPASRATAKKAKKAKKSAAKKAVSKSSPAKKAFKKQKQGRSTPIKTAATPQAAKAPTPKTAWKISPEVSQSVVDIDIWKKGDLKIEHLTVYRSGWIVVDQLPDLSGYNPDEGVDIFEEFEFEEHDVSDGSEETSFFPKELPAEECERLMTLSEEELVDEGWTIETATRFSGPLVVEEVAVPPAA